VKFKSGHKELTPAINPEGASSSF
jgi:hypothetical protein